MITNIRIKLEQNEEKSYIGEKEMLDSEKFFEKYRNRNQFDKSALEWEELEKIYRNYVEHRQKNKEIIANELEELFNKEIRNEGIRIHSIKSRYKDPEHLIEKIIRKTGVENRSKYSNINVENYFNIIRDLIGLKILVHSKEDWENVYDLLTQTMVNKYHMTMEEQPKAYIRYGDRDIYKQKIHKEYTNKSYRAQHYIMKYKDNFFEVQVKTLTEEVYGEFDHYVRYPYRQKNNFLKRYTSIVSELLDSVDEIISTCFQFEGSGWEQLETYFDRDHYEDWSKIAQKSLKIHDILPNPKVVDDNIDVKSYMENIFLRKEG